MMTELELFAQFTLRHGGVWYLLESCKNASMYKTQSSYSDGRNDFYNEPVYQVFNAEGKRVIATTNYAEAFNKYVEIKAVRIWQGAEDRELK